MTVVAAMATAIVSTTTAVGPRCFVIERSAKRISDISVGSKRVHGAHRRRSSRGKRPGQKSDDEDQERCAADDRGVVAIDADQHRATQLSEAERESGANEATRQRNASDMTQHEPANVTTGRA